MLPSPYPVFRSLASYILPSSIMKRPGSGGSFSSKYCYSVWLRHLIHLEQNGLLNKKPVEKIAEIGPGDSLEIGMSALLTGATEYYAFDVIEHTKSTDQLEILSKLSNYFLDKIDIPYREPEFRNTKPIVDNNSFPEFLIKEISIENISDRTRQISNALNDKESSVKIEYIVPWYEKEIALKGQIDLIISQAVMEHVDDIQDAYSKMYEWLRPGGIITHQIDYKAHEMTKEWYGHWYLSDPVWSFLLEGRKYSINRYPHSAHIKAIEKAGFEIKNIVPFNQENKLKDKLPAIKNRVFTKEDMTISSALIQAVKV